jgi:hypothetical protein
MVIDGVEPRELARHVTMLPDMCVMMYPDPLAGFINLTLDFAAPTTFARGRSGDGLT